ncbi:MAG: hypothetical protein ACRD2J_14575 [Thermoanaerobaculia bacterium]
MDVDYRSLSDDLESGAFRQRLREELRDGFERMNAEGDRLPPPSYYAAKIAEVIDAGAPVPLTKEFAYDLYQEILVACEEARRDVVGDERTP